VSSSYATMMSIRGQKPKPVDSRRKVVMNGSSEGTPKGSLRNGRMTSLYPYELETVDEPIARGEMETELLSDPRRTQYPWPRQHIILRMFGNPPGGMRHFCSDAPLPL
jgi:hypothetical protein